MDIAGIQKTSLIDYPGKIAAVVFTSGCNFYCHFCHNPELVNPKLKFSEIPEKEVFDFLKKRKNILDGVVITGGEPTMHSDLPEFIKKIRKLGFLVKLDTNGTNPKTLKALIASKLIDYIAMDIKGSVDKYDKIIGVKVNKKDILESIKIIKNSKIDYEFRTTIVPTLHEKADFTKIGKMINNAKKYYLQQFRPEKTLDPKFAQITPFSAGDLQEFARIMNKYVKYAGIRGI